MRQGVITTGLNHLMHMVRDDLWEIRNGKARLINTDDDEIQILSQNKIHLLSDFNFSNDLDAAKTIVDYYSSEYQLSIYNGGTFSLDPQNFISKQAMYNAGLTENTLMSVTLTYNSSSVDINSKFYLLRGRFHQVLDNKYNFINSIGHEYKHYLDNLGFKSKFNNGFRGMQSISGSRAELRAINYQQKLPSWDSTTSNYRRSVELYKSKQL
ncbi:zincin-like metallopeptidase toxin 2 of polymorphic toxin system [Myroides indicus]|uniref:Zincin-like metallopeptidase toxin 2 of polymorphic toxin system n=2 Tax=Myroides indicus TaxID=1323422 RepID=A0A4R7EQT3_9FLAO|nr:zincin-like metallopeptidase toxin 2 of polymorphic toxin system [Myroides indicus]